MIFGCSGMSWMAWPIFSRMGRTRWCHSRLQSLLLTSQSSSFLRWMSMARSSSDMVNNSGSGRDEGRKL